MTDAHSNYRHRDMRAKYLGAIAVSKQTDAMGRAIAEINAQFSVASEINSFKLRVDGVMLLGARHPGIRVRYKAAADKLTRVPLTSAIRLIDHWYYREYRQLQWGDGSRHTFTVLRELRLILRWMRKSGRACQFQTYIDEVLL